MSAVNGVETRRAVVGLLLGIAANVHAIALGRDLSAYAMSHWSTWYWLGSPIVVALAHVAAYLMRARAARRAAFEPLP